jgi:thiosulfate dehydrogenase
MQTDLPPGELGAEIKYGYELITKTSNYIGPLAKNPAMQFSGNNLSCNNCHLNAGRKIGSGSFVGVFNRFPQFRGRENKMGTLEERINGCMERSMNGRVMPEDSEEMKAIIAYMEWLSKNVPDEIEKQYKGYVPIEIPDYKADPVRGAKLYRVHCRHCHQDEGAGMKTPGEEFTGYVYPPIGGRDTYNDGAGMNRVITAAQFIKGNMPFGATYDAPLLSDDEAYHIAAYINTFDRPTKPNRELDFPDKKLKPVSTPYGPWEDDFSAEQHKFGPFPPIIEYYRREYDLVKNK